MKITTYNRLVLYEQVWQEPVTAVSARYGISDVGLRKICSQLKVPLPDRGYWAKTKAGAKLKKKPLPKYDGPDEIKTFRQPTWREERLERYGIPADLAVSKISNEAKTLCNNIAVPDKLRHPHPLISASKDKTSKSDNQDGGQSLKFQVSVSALDRTLRIVDTIVKTLEKLKYSVVLDPKTGDTVAVIEGEKLRFYIKERFNQIEHVLTPQEARARKRGEVVFAPAYDYISTGELTLALDHYWAKRKNWHDTEHQKIESCLGSFILMLIQTAYEMQIERAEDERKKRIEQEAQHRRQLARERREKEQAMFKALEEAAGDWHKSQVVAGFISAVEERIGKGELEETAELLRWIAWAKTKAAWLNPLTTKEDPILGVRRAEPVWLTRGDKDE